MQGRSKSILNVARSRLFTPQTKLSKLPLEVAISIKSLCPNTYASFSKSSSERISINADIPKRATSSAIFKRVSFGKIRVIKRTASAPAL